MTLFRSLAFALVFYVGSIVLVSAAGVSAVFGREALFAAARVWARFHYFCVRWLLGIEVVVEGRFPSDGIIAIKHESMLETLETLRLIDRPAVVLKAELLDIPLWGRVARTHGAIPVAREAGAAALRAMLTAARQAKADGRPIVIFPEGTRVVPGESPPLRPGFVGLYKSLGVPVVPVALDSGRLWPRGGLAKHAGRVTIRIGAPIPPGLPRDEIEARVHTAINALNADYGVDQKTA